MSEESERISLRDYVDTRLAALNVYVEAGFETARDARQTQITAINEATRIATTAMDRRLENMNEFREQLSDWAARFITRADVDSSLKYLGDRINALETNIVSRQEHSTIQEGMSMRVTSLEKTSNNLQGRMWAIAAIVMLIDIALRFVPEIRH